MPKTITISPNEAIRVGQNTFRYCANKGRGEIVVRVEGDGEIAHVSKGGRERILNKVATAAKIIELGLDTD